MSRFATTRLRDMPFGAGDAVQSALKRALSAVIEDGFEQHIGALSRVIGRDLVSTPQQLGLGAHTEIRRRAIDLAEGKRIVLGRQMKYVPVRGAEAQARVRLTQVLRDELVPGRRVAHVRSGVEEGEAVRLGRPAGQSVDITRSAVEVHGEAARLVLGGDGDALAGPGVEASDEEAGVCEVAVGGESFELKATLAVRGGIFVGSTRAGGGGSGVASGKSWSCRGERGKAESEDGEVHCVDEGVELVMWRM